MITLYFKDLIAYHSLTSKGATIGIVVAVIVVALIAALIGAIYAKKSVIYLNRRFDYSFLSFNSDLFSS